MTKYERGFKKSLMNNSSTITLLTIALSAILVLFGVNFITFFQPATKGNQEGVVGNLTVALNEVKGIAIEKGKELFTLNQKQQNEALTLINRMRPVDKGDYPIKEKFEFTRIIIYRFNKPDIDLFPIANQKEGLVFNVPILNSSSYLLDMSGGQFYDLIKKGTQE